MVGWFPLESLLSLCLCFVSEADSCLQHKHACEGRCAVLKTQPGSSSHRRMGAWALRARS